MAKPAQTPVTQLRLVVEAEDFEPALRFYRDVLGLVEEEAYEGDGDARVVILGAGRATLELANPAQKELIDRVEAGGRPSRRLRVALEVADTEAVTTRLVGAGATLIAPPVETPWRSLNSRLEGPAGLELTVFQELDQPPTTVPEGRYSRIEYERRFLLDVMPEDLADGRQIIDEFVPGTGLRLRTIRDLDSGIVAQAKLGQKVRPNPDDPTVIWHTTMYLTPEEMSALSGLARVVVTKTRWQWLHQGQAAVVDVYEGDLAGLVVAEICFADETGLRSFHPDAPLGAEITGVEALTGPNLAAISAVELAALLGGL